MIIWNSGKIHMKPYYRRQLKCFFCGGKLKKDKFRSVRWTTAKNRMDMMDGNVGPPVYVCYLCEKKHDKQRLRIMCQKKYMDMRQ